MPLPQPNSEWPPDNRSRVYRDLAAWSAWWSGDPDMLSLVYSGFGPYGGVGSFNRTANGGRMGVFPAIHRFFWGEKQRPGESQSKLHVPVAAEIAQISADLMFGQPPTVTIADDTDKATQDRLDLLLSDRAATQLHEAAETCAALGHVYLRVGWDRDIDPTGPLMSVVDADAAYAKYAYGHLIEVTFVREWDFGNGDVLRHLELHEVGVIWHAAYLGGLRNLGRQVPLSMHPQTTDVIVDGMIADDARAGSGIETGLDILDVVGVANQRSKTWRHLPQARDLGAADIAGVEGSLDALDDVFSSWMRDIRHGRSRIHVPMHMLEPRGPGRGDGFDLDRELYVGLEAPPDGALQLTATQFAIRFQEHHQTAIALLERIVGGAGYSLQTFGLDKAHTAQTATESWARQNRTQNTRNGKLRHWNRALLDLTKVLLAVDNAQFGGTNNVDAEVTVQFADTVSDSQLTRAQTAQLLRSAEAASTRTLVELVHNDWDGDQIDAEVARIEGDATAQQPGPGVGVGSHGTDPSQPVPDGNVFDGGLGNR